MDTQTLINILFGAIGALLSWILKSVTDSVKELQGADTNLAAKVQEIELLVIGDYIKHSDFKEFSNAIFAKLDRMEAKIDGKQDKPK